MRSKSLDPFELFQLKQQKLKFQARKAFVLENRHNRHKLLSERRLERYTLQNEAGQPIFGINPQENEKISTYDYALKKKYSMARTKLISSLNKTGNNEWDNFATQSKKMVEIAVRYFSIFRSYPCLFISLFLLLKISYNYDSSLKAESKTKKRKLKDYSKSTKMSRTKSRTIFQQKTGNSLQDLPTVYQLGRHSTKK